MSMVCCLSQRPQHALQIPSTIRAPMVPGNGGRSKPSRVSPQRVHVTSAGMTEEVDGCELRAAADSYRALRSGYDAMNALYYVIWIALPNNNIEATLTAESRPVT